MPTLSDVTGCRRLLLAATCVVAVLPPAPAGQAQTALPGPGTATPHREFPVGSVRRLDELPPGRFRSRLDALPLPARDHALQWLRSFHFTEADLPSLHADSTGAIFYECALRAATAVPGNPEPTLMAGAAVPVDPFPASLVFHSRPGAPNILFLNFAGETVSGTLWNTELGRTEIPAVAFSVDSDLTTFSSSEQTAIQRVWDRVAEDYAPFDIDVTTERPATFTTRTALALITRTTDANGDDNPSSSAGGVGYVNVFGSFSYAKYRPVWIYHDNLANVESYLAEAASHEVGHNLGLSHDGLTDGTEYYDGHGSGDISWGTIMGACYNRNVTHWSKGEYHLANNTQDDLATIAGKLTYRPDDHGGTQATATALTVSGGTNIVATTPQTDPTNSNPANKGVLERNTDLDVLSFVTGSGAVQLAVNPWIMPSGTRGGNLDILVELHDEAGSLLLTNNPAAQTAARVETNLTEGRYFLHIRNSGAGGPFNSPPTGYTEYGSIGQYFVTGFVARSTGYIAPPLAELQATDLTTPGMATHHFDVTYSDDVAVAVSTIGPDDARVTGPNNYDQPAQLASLSSNSDGTPRTATYTITPLAAETWSPADNGTYTVWMEAGRVGDVEGAFVAEGKLGQFHVAIPMAVYAAGMDADPGWTLEPDWQYGPPAYGASGPTSGSTGTKIVAFNLSGDYANNLPPTYATTPPINTTGSSSLTLRFQRWLRTRRNDAASIQASADGATWLEVWSSSNGVSDSSWREVRYPLPPEVTGSASLRLRWGLATSRNQSDLGWNIDDVEVLGDGTLDTTPPVPLLSVADVTLAGSPSHSCSVTYTDDTAVRLASLDSTDLAVDGPNGYAGVVEFIGADLPSDGSPITATYSIPAPGGAWDATDNGTYSLTLAEDAVQDTLNNSTPEAALGAFQVEISTATPGVLSVVPASGLTSTGDSGGPFSPGSILYTLTNTGDSPLNWTAGKSQTWLSLSAGSGTLDPDASTTLTVSINTGANNLSPGDYSDTVSFLNTSTGDGSTGRAIDLTVTAPTTVELTLAPNNPDWGTVSPASGSYPAGTTVELLATPATYFEFKEWLGDASGKANPLALELNANTLVVAVFAELLTTNHPTPFWWLAEQGYTGDFESAVDIVGANGLPLWQSYVAGLDPSDPASTLQLTGELSSDGTAYLLHWATVPDRAYTILFSTNVAGGFAPLPGASDLPSTVQTFSDPVPPEGDGRFYCLQVRKP